MAGQHVNMTIKVFLSRARWLQSVLTTRKPDLLTAWLKYKYVGTHPQSPTFCVFAVTFILNQLCSTYYAR